VLIIIIPTGCYSKKPDGTRDKEEAEKVESKTIDQTSRIIFSKPWSFSTGNDNFKPEPWIVNKKCLEYLPEFKWDSRFASISHSESRYSGKYSIVIVPVNAQESKIVISFGGEVKLRLIENNKSVFIIDEDTFYIAVYSPIKMGCSVLSYSLSNGDVIWKTKLLGILYALHSCYSNLVNMSFEKEKGILIIFGKEAGGEYIECVDANTGNILAHKIISHYSPGSLEKVMQIIKYGEDKHSIKRINKEIQFK